MEWLDIVERLVKFELSCAGPMIAREDLKEILNRIEILKGINEDNYIHCLELLNKPINEK